MSTNSIQADDAPAHICDEIDEVRKEIAAGAWPGAEVDAIKALVALHAKHRSALTDDEVNALLLACAIVADVGFGKFHRNLRASLHLV